MLNTQDFTVTCAIEVTDTYSVRWKYCINGVLVHISSRLCIQ